jgi:NitT/TauT family transport system substrate-binding protein
MPERPIQVGYFGSACEAYIYAAELLGLYEKNGFKIDLIRVDNAIARDGIASGKLDVTEGILQTWLKPVEQGLDLRFTLGMHQGCSSIVIKSDEPYKTLADLKGKIVGVQQPFGAGGHNYAIRAFIAAGVDPTKDVEWRAFETGALGVALDKGEVAAISVGDTTSVERVSNGEWKYIHSMATAEELKDEVCCLLAMNPKFIRDYPDAARLFTKVIYDATIYTQSHVEEVIRYVFKKQYLSGTLENNIAVAKTYPYIPGTESAVRSFENSFRDYQKAGIIDQNVDLQKVLDRSFVIFDGIED